MRRRKTYCVNCERPAEEVGRISLNGLCKDCGISRQVANAEQIANREGVFYEAWLRGLGDYADDERARASA